MPLPKTKTRTGEFPFEKNKKISKEEFIVDLSNVAESNFVIEAGRYKMRCIDVVHGISKAKNPMIIWTFVIVAGKHAKREWKMFTALTPDALWKVAEVLKALGIPFEKKKIKFVPKDIINRECWGHIVDDSYNDEPRSSLKKVTNLEEADPEDDEEAEPDEEESEGRC